MQVKEAGKSEWQIINNVLNGFDPDIVAPLVQKTETEIEQVQSIIQISGVSIWTDTAASTKKNRIFLRRNIPEDN